MGWHTAFASVADWPNALRERSAPVLLVVLLPPLVNALFITAISLAFLASRGGRRSGILREVSGMIAALCVPLAIISFGLLFLGITWQNGWGPGQTRPSVGIILWPAAYLTLGLRLTHHKTAAAATREDWKTSPMPAQRASLPLELTFDDAEFQTLARGCAPEQMEDKWFLYFERPWLYLHRSWTGICVYQVRFESEGLAHRVVEAIANRDPHEYREQNDKQDVLLLSMLLCEQAGRDCESLRQEYAVGQSTHGTHE